MSEPTYEYIKGQGWVAQPPHPSLTHRFGDYVVNLTLRRPRQGEHFWSDCHSLDRYMEYFSDYTPEDFKLGAGALYDELYHGKLNNTSVIEITYDPI